MAGFNKNRETVKIDFFFITIKRFNTHILKNLIGKASNKFKKTIAQHRVWGCFSRILYSS